jgi:hypothetical protein
MQYFHEIDIQLHILHGRKNVVNAPNNPGRILQANKLDEYVMCSQIQFMVLKKHYNICI